MYSTHPSDIASDPKGKIFKFSRVNSLGALRNTAGSYFQSEGTVTIHRPNSSSWNDANEAGIEGVFHTESLIKLGGQVECFELSEVEIGLAAGLSHLLFYPSPGSHADVRLSDCTFAWCWDDLANTLSSNIIVQNRVTMNIERIRSYGAKNDGLSVKAESDISIADSFFYDCGDETFSPHDESRGTATGCSFSGGGFLNAGPPSDGHTVAVVQGSEWTFRNCSFTKSKGLSPTVWVADIDNRGTTARFFNCTFSSGAFGPSSARAGVLFSGNADGEVVNCEFSNYLNPTSGCGRGVVYQNEVDGKRTNLSIQNNAFLNSRIGIEAVGKVGTSNSHILMFDNVFVDVVLNSVCGSGWIVSNNGTDTIWN